LRVDDVRRRRDVAMVATEAAMEREKDPGRYRRLGRRNMLAAVGAGWQKIPAIQDREWYEDNAWLKRVDDGTWVPNNNFSNCLVEGLRSLRIITESDPGIHTELRTLLLDDSGAWKLAWPQVRRGVEPTSRELALLAVEGTVEVILAHSPLAEYPPDTALFLLEGVARTILVPPGYELHARHGAL
jgi:hypothetical protein